MSLAGSAVDLYFKNGVWSDDTGAYPAGSTGSDSAQLLLHCDGGAGSQTFNDATGRHRITAGGNAQVDTAQSKFGGASALFDGSSDYLLCSTDPDFVFGTGNFTIDFWIRFSTVSGNQNILDFRTANTSQLAPAIYLSSSTIRYYFNGSDAISGATTIAINTWYHLAVARSGTSTKLFLNGTQEGSTFSDSNNYIAGNVALGNSVDLAGSALIGWMDEIRILKGTAAWTTTFTPPTAPYAVTVATDPAHLLLHCDGADASTTFIDATGRHQIAVAGNTQVDTAQSKFGGASALFDGTGDYLSLGSSADFTFGTGDFTIDFWFRSASAGGAGIMQCFIADTTGNPFKIYYRDGTFRVNYNSSENIVGTATISDNVWYHVAVTRSSGSTKLFINGTQDGSTYSDSNNYPSGTVVIGIDTNLSSFPMNGWLDEFRILKGTAAWTTTFTPPTAPYNVALSGPYAHLSCSRASIGYAKNADGTLTQFASNALRIGNGTGILIEDARSNIALQSQTLGTTWGTDFATLTADQAVAPDGTTTMDKLDDGVATNRHIIQQNFASGVTITSPYTYSVFVKDVDRRYVQLLFINTNSSSTTFSAYFDLQAGTVSQAATITNSTTGTSCGSAFIEAFANGVYRIGINAMVPGGVATASTYIEVVMSNAGTGPAAGEPSYTGSSKSIYIWGAQLEIGPFPSSYVPTTSSSATRATDAVTFIGAPVSMMTTNPFSIVISAILNPVSSLITYPVLLTSNSVLSRSLYVTAQPDYHVITSEDETSNDLSATLGGGGSWLNGAKVGVAVDVSARSIVGDAGTVATDANGYVMVSPINIMKQQSGDTQSQFWGYTRRFTLWNTKLADATLQSLTSPFDSVPNFNMPMMGF